jgi:hypothetical protein
VARLLSSEKYTLDKIIKDGYDKVIYFELLIPALIKSFELEDKNGNTQYSNLKEPIALLKQWNFYATENSG